MRTSVHSLPHQRLAHAAMPVRSWPVVSASGPPCMQLPRMGITSLAPFNRQHQLGHGPHWLLTAHASKGFGSNTRQRADDDDDGPSNKPRARRVKRRAPQTVMPQQEEKPFIVDLQKKAADEAENKEFTERLKVLKQQGEELRTARAASPGTTPGSPTTAAPSANGIAAFDQPPESIYDNPPSLQETVLSSLNSDISDPKLKNAQFGPSQIGIAASAIIFGLVFVLVAGGDFAPNNRYKGVRSAQAPPDSIEAGIINTRIAELQKRLDLQPNDTETLQALALSYAQLLQYDKAAGYMDRVVARQPNNADGWRLLGETSLLAEQSQRAVKAYEKAISIRNDDLQIATGMVDSYIANGQYPKAVSYLEELRTRAPSVSALGVVAVDARTPAPAATLGQANEAEAAAPADSTATEAAAQPAAVPAPTSSAAEQDTPPLRPLEPVGVELLLAKTYSAWRGHDNDAITTYDNLIARFPEDFRGYLAKGVFLRDKGRRADAERMFLQAKFYAPENRQAFVKAQAETKPVIDLPDQ